MDSYCGGRGEKWFMDFSYTVVGGNVRIDKVEEPQREVVVPETVGGYLVTELGEYVLAGSGVEEVWLPGGLRKIGAYGFYNCENLRRIHCSSRTTDLGTGLFAGAGGVGFVDICVFDGEKSCLKELLSELRQTLRVRLRLCGQGEEESRGRGVFLEARLIFPEYYEESVENTPARILYIETHGCGHRYRYCFAGTQFQYQKYDELFPHAKVQEPEELVAEMALGRLQYPLGLAEKYRGMYQGYVAGHWRMAARLMMEAGRQGAAGSILEPGGVPWLVEEILGFGQEAGGDGELGEKLQELIRMAQEAGDTETVAWLMDFRHRRVLPGKRRFEL